MMKQTDYKNLDRLANSYVVKCVLLGDAGTGKTTLINVLTNGVFDNSYEPTIGIDFGSKNITLPDYGNQQIKLQIWDTAGQEKYKSIINSYLRDAHIAFLVFDITNLDSWSNLSKWKETLEMDIKYDYIPLIILVATKSDLKHHAVTEDQIKQRVDEWGCSYCIISAKESNSQTKILRMFSIAAEKFHQLIVYKHINGYEIPENIYQNCSSSYYQLNDNDEKREDSKFCCFQ